MLTGWRSNPDDFVILGHQYQFNIDTYSYELLQHHGITSQEIYIIVPFISTLAYENIELYKEYNGTEFIKHIVAPELVEQLPVINLKPYPKYSKINDVAIPIYFDHNIPEPFCTLTNLIKSVVSNIPSRMPITIEHQLFLAYCKDKK